MAPAVARVRSHEDPDGRGEHAARATHPALREVLTRPPVGQRQTWTTPFGGWLEAPRLVVKLLIDLDGAVTADGRRLPAAWVGGPGLSPTVVGLEGRAYGSVDLELSPLGAYAVLGCPVSELGDRPVALADVLGSLGDALAGRVRTAPDWDARFDLVEDLLRDRVGRGPRPTPAVAFAWSRLAATRGRSRIASIAAEVGMSRRHLTATFTREVGLPPKAAARLLRFAEVRRQIDAAPGRWADIALDAGYADQSHLNREFRQLAGITPGEFVARRMPHGGVSGAGLPFVQDAARPSP